VDEIQRPTGDLSGEAERRSKMRFPIALGVRFAAHRSPIVGAGQTVNISSKGALIASEQRVSVGERIELSVDWPVKLNGSTTLQFFAIARVLRSDGGAFALSLAQHEFRTMKKQPQSESDYEAYKAKLR
jgi:PilZ domain